MLVSRKRKASPSLNSLAWLKIQARDKFSLSLFSFYLHLAVKVHIYPSGGAKSGGRLEMFLFF